MAVADCSCCVLCVVVCCVLCVHSSLRASASFADLDSICDARLRVGADKLEFSDGSGTLATHVPPASSNGLGTGAFGKVAAFKLDGAPVAVKELKLGMSDARSLGTYVHARVCVWLSGRAELEGEVCACVASYTPQGGQSLLLARYPGGRSGGVPVSHC